MTNVLLMLAIGIFLAGCYVLLQETSQGQRWITLKGRSKLPADRIFSNLERHWRDHALTFQEVRLLPESTPDRMSFSPDIAGLKHATTMERLPAETPRTIVLSCVNANGIRYPLGQDHRKIWQVEPRDDGCDVTISVRLRAPVFAIVEIILNFRSQMRRVVAGE